MTTQADDTKVTRATKTELDGSFSSSAIPHRRTLLASTFLFLRDLRDLRVVFVLALVVLSLSPAAQSLPDGPGADVARARCLSCHETDLIVQQRLSRAGWEREIDKMVRWGAVLQPAERLPLVEYLSTRYAPPAAIAHTSTSGVPGEAIYKRACLTCHEQDLIEQQRLTRAGWLREVDKMIRWGATVPDADKDALVDFLATRYR